MYDRILFPTDGSEGATAVFERALDIAATHGATVHVLYVADTTRDSVTTVNGEVVDVLEREGERVVEETAARARERNVMVVPEVRQGRPYQVIVEYASRMDVDLVVMPTHGRTGLERLLLGSVTERVVRRSDVPVLTVNPDADPAETYPFGNVLVPTDGSACADAALQEGIDLTDVYDATLHLLTVVDVASLGVDVRVEMVLDTLEDSANTILDDATERATEAGVDSIERTVEYGASIPAEISSYVTDHDVDLVVVGTHGRTGLDRYLLGSVTEQLVRTSPVAVLTVREPIEGAS